jgi:OOP family OmpA-OmpF porin
MKTRVIRLIIAGAAAAALFSTSAFAQSEVQGIVVTNQNGQLTLKTPAGNQVVPINIATDVKSISGPLGGQRQTQPLASLIPGLPVTVDLDASGQATKIEYKAKDYETAAQIQAGVEATAAKTEAALTALSKVGQYNVRAETAVYYPTGSYAISAQGKKDLAAVAQQAQGFQGYIISVLGYADPTGNVADNQRLSARRAQTVINFLKQQPGIQPGRVLSASAMGEVQYAGAADPSTFSSDRRVNVRVVTSAAQLPPPGQ